ncbi:TonB-dependent receptor [Pluralibacter gergoviae]|uniref:TonB-dependent receptor n=1 Tax=Pluralibacter gergoviae TaxID=61647 RepID=UPI0006500D13|nr:TonB-dependent siderophore receptor [Pluralibacter gergoviae]EKV0928003.1 TonB-dependent siderophore receptor [Pluralibacter gergoviae]EKV6245939.1 TonB-dependent siderophore receptor [Pluralibacter gergoviae]EKW9968344.1 TonB-dependent siderophore receptor [Pluralibacter gergoviae]ELD4269265.1 TonB-dependent siderophore receptor [Pluralibacter gergoviae]ELD4275470.1 TonB-dependent siderophore receptor [Pluralibacter gergoviae]
MQNTSNTAFAFRKTLIALAVGAVSYSAAAADSTAAKGSTKSEETLVVQATEGSDFKPGGDQLVPAYLDGQIAHGGRLGMLGEQKAMDVPFNVIGFTSKLIKDQQAKTITDVVRNDAGVQPVQGFGNFGEGYRIRGFKFDGDDMTMGGLAGVVPRQVMDTQMLERVEVFKGANSLVNGAASSGVGGLINLEPKRAEDTPITSVGVDYTSDSQLGGTLDLGRRFGDSNQFGARVNLVHREGDTATNDDRRRTTLASVGLDYRGDRLRTSLDAGYQKKTFHGGETGLNTSAVDFVPKVPDNRKNYGQKWGYSDIENEFGMAKAEYDLTDSWTTYAAFGGQHAHETGTYSTPKLLDRAGDATVSRMDTNRIIDSWSGMAGIRGDFDTGPVSHKVNVGYSARIQKDKTAWRMATKNLPTTNIYDNHNVYEPDNSLSSGDYHDPLTSGRQRMQGWLLSDTLGFFDDKVLLTGAARYQTVIVRGYNANTGREDTGSHFTDSRWMPTYGLVYKPWETLSLYANHTEALQPSNSAPTTALNVGQTVGILHSKQNEIGAKIDYGRIGGSLALFQIKKPLAMVNENQIYAIDGEQRHRGVELNVFGEPMLGLRLNGSATWLDPEMRKTANAANDGNDAIGVARFYMVLGAEYDIKPVEGLTATARVNHTGSQYADAANDKKLSDYTTLDLGVRYRTRVNADQNEMVWRLGVDNVTNKKYWSGANDSSSYLYQGAPRTVKVSMSYDF